MSETCADCGKPLGGVRYQEWRPGPAGDVCICEACHAAKRAQYGLCRRCRCRQADGPDGWCNYCYYESGDA
jgi:hypothetical protein